jgi:hypothetical protein
VRRAPAIFSVLWKLVAGDDWQTALGVVAALAATAALVEAGIAAWWVMPPAVLALLALSVRRAARGASRVRRPARPDARGAARR